jgi:hypothetical protein
MVAGVFFSISIDGTCLPACGAALSGLPSAVFRARSHGLGSSFIIHHLSFII